MQAKPGNPPLGPTVLVEGHRSLMDKLRNGTADRGDCQLVANWLRDLYAEKGCDPDTLIRDYDYRTLVSGVPDKIGNPHFQRQILGWILTLLEIPEGKYYVMSASNDRQVAGSHYQSAVQHWDFVDTNGLSYLGGQATKYVTRARKKNGVVDLEKAEHFLQKITEKHDSPTRAAITLQEFFNGNPDMTFHEKIFVAAIHAYESTDNPGYLHVARLALAECLSAARQGGAGSP